MRYLIVALLLVVVVALFALRGSSLDPIEKPRAVDSIADSAPSSGLSGPRLPLIEDTSATRTERIAVEPAVQVHRVVRPLYGGLTEGYVAWLSGDLGNSTVAAWAAVVEAQEAAEASDSLRLFADVYERLSEHVLAAAVERHFLTGDYEVVPPSSPDPSPSSGPGGEASPRILWRRVGQLDFEEGRHRAEVRVVLDSSVSEQIRSLGKQRQLCSYELALQAADDWNRLPYTERTAIMEQHDAARVAARELADDLRMGRIEPADFAARMNALRERRIDVRISVDRITLLAKPRQGR
jgi:hypothetical protein